MKLFNLSVTIKKCDGVKVDGENCTKIFLPWQKPSLELEGKIYCTNCHNRIIYEETKKAQEKEQADWNKKSSRLISTTIPPFGMTYNVQRGASGHSGKLIKGAGYGHSGFSGKPVDQNITATQDKMRQAQITRLIDIENLLREDGRVKWQK